MNRLQRKCIIVSVGFHLLLLVILFVGAAFFSRDDGVAVKPLDFIPAKVIEGAIAGGGNPDANPLPPAPPAPQPPAPVTPPVQEEVKVEQPKVVPKPEPVKVERPGPAPAPPKVKPVKQPPQISTQLVTSKPTTNKTTSKTTSTAKDDQRKKAAEQFGKAVAGLRNNLAPTTSIDLRGVGGGGETYAGVQQTILSTYDRAWISPEGMDTSEAVVEVEVTVESDGTVSSAHITKPSGDARVDSSVQKALRNVSSIPGWDGKKRTVEFSFKSRAKEII